MTAERARPRPSSARLVAAGTRFIGRSGDLDRLRALLDEHRLVTIWGPGGIGKTRLALEVIDGRARVAFCELSAARDLGGLCTAVAFATGGPAVTEAPDLDPTGGLTDALSAAGPLLLVLDNLEQLIDDAGVALSLWLARCPELRLLCTSRERLRLAGEASFELLPLALPREDGDLDASEAVALLLDRIRAADPHYRVTPDSAATLAELSRKLEGIPLVIELAAARVDLLGAAGLLARLPSRLDLLASGRRDADRKESTLRGAIEWSWNLLSTAEQRALAQCAVFAGGFTPRAAEQVIDVAGARPLDLIQALRDKSLLRQHPRDGVAADPDAGGEAQLSLYDAIRALAAEKLASAGEAIAAHERYAAWILALAAEAAPPERPVELVRLARHRDGLLAVFDQASSEQPATISSAARALRALLALDPLAAARGPLELHVERLDRALAVALAAGVEPLLLAQALRARGRAHQAGGHAEPAVADLELALAKVRAAGERRLEAALLTDLGVLHHQRRDIARTAELYEAARAIHRSTGDRLAEGRVVGNRGALHHDVGDFDPAREHYLRALEIFRAAGDRRAEGVFHTNLGVLDQEQGRLDEARRHFDGAVALLAAADERRLLAITLGNLGVLHHEQRRTDDALACHGQALAALREVGDLRSLGLCLARSAGVLALLDRRDEAADRFDEAERVLAPLGDPPASEAVVVWRAFLDLARCARARVEQRLEDAAARLAAALDRIARARGRGDGGAPPMVEISDDVRTAVRLVEQQLAALLATPVDEPPRSDAALLVGAGGRWFRPPGGAVQELGQRATMRRILSALIERQRHAPGRPMTLEALCSAGWPGEKILPEAAANRAYVAIAQLRKSGLKRWLETREHGYLLAPSLSVQHTFGPPADGV